MIAAGLAVGLLSAALATRYLASLLFGIQPTDPLTYAGVVTLLATVSLLALYLPTGRATNFTPNGVAIHWAPTICGVCFSRPWRFRARAFTPCKPAAI